MGTDYINQSVYLIDPNKFDFEKLKKRLKTSRGYFSTLMEWDISLPLAINRQVGGDNIMQDATNMVQDGDIGSKLDSVLYKIDTSYPKPSSKGSWKLFEFDGGLYGTKHKPFLEYFYQIAITSTTKPIFEKIKQKVDREHSKILSSRYFDYSDSSTFDQLARSFTSDFPYKPFRSKEEVVELYFYFEQIEQNSFDFDLEDEQRLLEIRENAKEKYLENYKIGTDDDIKREINMDIF